MDCLITWVLFDLKIHWNLTNGKCEITHKIGDFNCLNYTAFFLYQVFSFYLLGIFYIVMKICGPYKVLASLVIVFARLTFT